jgi:hypothetical protein
MADPTTLEVCLKLTDSPPEVCGLSSSKGQLTGIFFGASSLGVPVAELGFERGEIGVGQRCASQGVVTCGDADISGLFAKYNFTYGLAVDSGGGWFNNRSASLGCFYITGTRALTPPLEGWDFGLTFRDTDGVGTYSRMYKPLFSPLYPQLGTAGGAGALDLREIRGCDYGVSNVRLASSDAHAASCLTCTDVSLRLVDYQLAEVSINPGNFLHICTYSLMCKTHVSTPRGSCQP